MCMAVCRQLACAATLAGVGRLVQVGSPVGGGESGVSVGTLVHLLADGVHQAVKDLLHVDAVFGTGLEELEA